MAVALLPNAGDQWGRDKGPDELWRGNGREDAVFGSGRGRFAEL